METRIRIEHCIGVMSFSASFFPGLNRFKIFRPKEIFARIHKLRHYFRNGIFHTEFFKPLQTRPKNGH